MIKHNFAKLAKIAAGIAEDKKCSDVVVINVKKFSPIADFFVIATATSNPQRNAVVTTIEKTFEEIEGPSVFHRDGRASDSWSVLDYSGVIIHIMSPQARAFFALEKMWKDSQKHNG